MLQGPGNNILCCLPPLHTHEPLPHNTHIHTYTGSERERFFAGKYDVLGIEPLHPFPESVRGADPFVEVFGENTFTQHLMDNHKLLKYDGEQLVT